MVLKTSPHFFCYHAFLTPEAAADYIPMLAQELEQVQHYNEDEQEEDDNDDDNDEVLIREEEPEEWMLLCRLNQQYDHEISQGSQSRENAQFDWTETARAVPPGLLHEAANWMTKRRNEALEDPTIVNRQQHQPVNPEQLNGQQRLAFNMLAMHHAALISGTPQQPLQMIVTREEGSGKSFLISATKTLLGDKCKLTGTTGLAGYNIEGCTLHSALQLPVRNHNNVDLHGAALQRLQLRFSRKRYLTTDEMSMLGQRTSLG